MFYKGRAPAPPREKGAKAAQKNWGVLALRTYVGSALPASLLRELAGALARDGRKGHVAKLNAPETLCLGRTPKGSPLGCPPNCLPTPLSRTSTA
jgi:hypothetical protein